jgi:hypothetical protein
VIPMAVINSGASIAPSHHLLNFPGSLIFIRKGPLQLQR